MSTGTLGAPPLLRVCGLRKRFGAQEVLKGVDLEVAQGEFFSLLGASGCGKTTLLRILAGFETADEGTLEIGGVNATHTPVQERDLNLVFQNYALFPHMTVYENVAFGLKVRKKKSITRQELNTRVENMLELTRMSPFARRYPGQLSGGQQQRVALARALAPHPSLLLLDEPMGALDAGLRQEMQRELRALQRRLGLTFIYVTHDQDEALALSDRIALLHEGALLQVGTPEDIYARPASRAVAAFFPEGNVLMATVRAPVPGQPHVVRAHCSGIGVEVEATVAPSGAPNAPQSQNTLHLLVRPERLHILCKEESRQSESADARVESVSYLGRERRYVVRLANGQQVVVSQNGGAPIAPGEAVSVSFLDARLHALPAGQL